ncbi:hypothetical protein RTBOTA2_000059 [Rhodotorula toruloides]|nr:hypothetical protein RTBOTA2_000059 [Rhodotorula toruloides]
MFSARSLLRSSLGQFVAATASKALDCATATVLSGASSLMTCFETEPVASKPRSSFFEPTRAKPAAPALSLVAPLAVAASSASPHDSVTALDVPRMAVDTPAKKELIIDVPAPAASLDIPEPPSPTLSAASSISSAPSSPIFDSDASSSVSQQVENVDRSAAYSIKREGLDDILASIDETLGQKGLLRGISLADIEAYGLKFIEMEEPYELALEASRGTAKFEEDEIEREERLCCRLSDHIFSWLDRQLENLDTLPPFDPTRPVAQTFHSSRLARLDSTDNIVDMRILRARLSFPLPIRQRMEKLPRDCRPDTSNLRVELAKRSCNLAEYKAQQRAQRAFVARGRSARGPAKRAMPIAQRRIPSSAPRFD